MLGRSVVKRHFSFTKATLPNLPFGYADLAPVLIPEVLEVHHAKHHKTYVDKYNDGVEKLQAALSKGDAQTASDLMKKVRFNGGGHVNHSLYWENLAPKNKAGGDLPSSGSKLTKCINDSWGSIDHMIKEFNAKTAEVQGSGWGWLTLDPKSKKLSIETSQNQSIISAEDKVPLIVIDVWEHAYYLQYKNLRPDYLKKIWEVINWKTAEKRFEAAGSK